LCSNALKKLSTEIKNNKNIKNSIRKHFNSIAQYKNRIIQYNKREWKKKERKAALHKLK